MAYGNAPGEQPTNSSSISVRVSYTHQLHGGNVSLQLYRQVQNGVLLPVYVNGSVLNQLERASRRVPAAGRADLRFTRRLQHAAQHAVYGRSSSTSQTPVSGVAAPLSGRRTHRLRHARKSRRSSRTTTSRSAGELELAISSTIPWSITIPGEQLPNLPLQKAGIVLDYKAPHSILEWLADAQHIGSNNPNNLPAYTTFDAGVTAQLTRGTLTFAATNITNTYGGIFASPANAVPYTTAGGYVIANIARPLMPRSYSLTYSASLRARRLSSQTASAFRPRGAGGGGGFFGGPGDRAAGTDPAARTGGRRRWRLRVALLTVAGNAAGRSVRGRRESATCSADERRQGATAFGAS